MEDNKIEYKFPSVTLKKIRPLLVEGKEIHVMGIEGESNGKHLNIYDNKCLELNDYLEKEMDCVLEITRGKIWYPYQKDKMPDSVIKAKYLWNNASHVFFPELMIMLEDPDESNSDEDNEEAFENAAEDIFSNWGLNGLGMEVFESKPMIQTDIGIFFINEYEFEEDIDVWELYEEFYVEIKEAYLRGINICIPEEDKGGEKIEKGTELADTLEPEASKEITTPKRKIKITRIKKN